MNLNPNAHARYILDGKIPVPCEDLLTWARWLEDNTEARIVRQEDVGPFWVSTVFMGLDHNLLFPDSPPDLFETLVFRNATEEDRRQMAATAARINYTGPLTYPRHIAMDDFCRRTPTWEMALEAHEEGVTWAREQMH